jgi:hypothetical protein
MEYLHVPYSIRTCNYDGSIRMVQHIITCVEEEGPCRFGVDSQGKARRASVMDYSRHVIP